SRSQAIIKRKSSPCEGRIKVTARRPHHSLPPTRRRTRLGAQVRTGRTTMNVMTPVSGAARYARCVENSKRVRWDIEADVIRGRRFDTAHKFLPDGLSLAGEFA